MIEELKKNLEKIDNKKERVYEFLEDGTYTKDMFAERLNKLELEKKKIQKSIDKIRLSIQNKEEWKEQYINLHEAIDMLKDPEISAKTKNIFLKSFIKVIYFEKHDRDSSSPKQGPVTESDNVKIEIILK